jgi:beta-phosphoglucomutase-like phosphatase (HAD superfamily)
MKFDRRVNKIFCDMDGVVADFDAFLMKYMGRTFPHMTGPADREMWKFLEGVKNLYYQLELTPYAKQLLDAILEVGCPVAMLTAIPRRSTIPEAEEDKRRWMKDKLPEYDIPVLIGPFSRDKY